MKRVLPLMGMLFAGYLTAGTGAANAAEYPLPPDNSRLIGENTTYVVPNDGKPLEAAAAKYQIGLIGMLEANPGTDPYLPKPGTVLTIPSQMLLPDTKREGIVVNLAELRLYYYPKGEDKVIVLPIGIGQLGRNTPEMVTSVSQKIPNPTWTPSQSQVWIVMQTNEAGELSFAGDSDAAIVKGLLAIVFSLYQGLTAQEVVELDVRPFFTALELSQHLTPSRSQGLEAMIRAIRANAQQLS